MNLKENDVVELSEDELDKVTGGTGYKVGDPCPRCKTPLEVKYNSWSVLQCPNCLRKVDRA